jgi:hypothetical protein
MGTDGAAGPPGRSIARLRRGGPMRPTRPSPLWMFLRAILLSTIGILASASVVLADGGGGAFPHFFSLL